MLDVWAHDLVAALALVALAIVQLWSLAGPGRLPQNLDLMLQYVPNAAFLARGLQTGHVPLWNPLLGTGMPFAADPGAGAWYVPNWPVLAVFPLFDAVRILVWLHLISAASGTYVFARANLRVGPAAAWVGAATFALTLWLPGLTGMPVVLTAVSWLPWVVIAGLYTAERGGRWIAVLATAGALQIVAGWPAGAYLSWLALGVLVVARSSRLGRVVSLARLAGGAASALLLAGVLLVPAAEFVGQTSYAATRPLSSVARDGYLTLLSWLRPAGGTGSLESSQLYLGMMPLLLAVVGALFGARRDARGLTVLAVLALVAAAGTTLPLFPVLYAWLPGFRIVYLPARIGIIAAFALAGLAALGTARLVHGPWLRRHAGRVVVASAALVPLVLVQFWYAEGYDNFRRLLTNLGRFSGGPFLTRQQEAHYLAFSMLGVAALVLAAQPRLRRSWIPALLVGITAADLIAAQLLARPAGFDPAAWYRPAYDAGARLRDSAGSQRTAGLQWHGQRHFLTDFPASADPSLLPPNLALLAGIRDVQGYNPLLLRRAVDYFAQINGRADDHWLWLERFDDPRSRDLAVSRVLVDSAAWRVTAARVGAPFALAPGQSVAVPVSATMSEPRPRLLRVISYLGEGTLVPQGVEVATVRVIHAGGATRSYPLRAGYETAEWAFGRPDVRAQARHQQAPVALETRVVDAVAGAASVYEYMATFGLAEDAPVARIEVVSTLPAGPGPVLHVAGILFDAPVTPDGGELALPNARPRLSLAGGRATIVRDEPERIDARVSSPNGGDLVLADAFYPGWIARLDGTPVQIAPSDGLFRSVPVPAGEHEVTFSYEPASLRLGLALSVLGVVVALALFCAVPGHRPGADPTRRQ